MDQEAITQALARLRSAADQTRWAWPTMRWSSGAEPDSPAFDLDGHGNFAGLAFEPGRDLVLRCRLDLPAEIAGIAVDGEPLLLTIFSIYPMDLSWNGQAIFEDTGVPVAAGPALVQVIPSLRAGDNGELIAHVHVPDNQTTPWFHLRFTTPGLRARFEVLDVAWAQLALADELAAGDSERAAVAAAAGCVPEQLVTGDAAALRAALGRMENALAPLAERASALTVHIIGHSHIDMNWLWTWPDTIEVIRRDFKSVLALMHDYPEMTFTHSQPATYEVIRQREPALFERIREHIQSGRWEPATLTWVEGDSNMASGEAHARQLLEGVLFSRQQLGAQPHAFLAPDTFGHAGNVPQLAASAGARYYYHHRANPGQADQWPAYWWEGQDGTRLLAISTYTYNGDILARDLAEAAIKARQHGHAASLHFHGIGDHGGGPARQNLEALRRFQGRSLLPSARCSTLAAYTRAILDSGVALPTYRGESSTIFEGCYTTHADTKRYNRAGENLLGTADTLAALAGQAHDQHMSEAWRALLFNQFHDILDGSAIHESYRKNAEDFAMIEAAAGAVIDRALAVLERDVQPGRIAVTNPLGWNRTDWVCVPDLPGQGAVWLEDERGNRTPGQRSADGLGFVARVPAFATVSYTIAAGEAALPPDLAAEACFAPTDAREINLLADVADEPPYYKIETPDFRVYLRRDSGILVGFLDKRVNRELIGYGMRRGSDYLDTARADLAFNVLQLLDEYPHGMSAWHLDEVHAEHSLLRGATTQIVEAGPARLVLETQRDTRGSRIVQRTIFYRDLARVDFQIDVDWRELGSPDQGVPNLKVAFTARLPECEAWFETPFAAVRRPSDGQETPALRWVDVGGASYGVALINDSKYGYDALGGRLRLTLLRSAYEPDAISDIGQHAIRYSLLPHPEGWREAQVVRHAAGFNQPLLARQVQHDRASVATSEQHWRPYLSHTSSVQIAGLKPAHDGSGWIARLYESGGRAVEAELCGLPDGAAVWLASLVEDRLSQLSVRNGAVRLVFHPWQVQTVLVERPASP
ncbi:MAG TPA: glycoside hydrolase family 38 C-terminal domain-containing protein [Roseiflexaceae bacterium]|nr:glycoside hydrolase family 38 C-terminal domain-containing protein [Roseiflexaceae bacterium]